MGKDGPLEVSVGSVRASLASACQQGEFIPPVSCCRYDLGVIRTIGMRYWRDLLDSGLDSFKLLGTFSKVGRDCSVKAEDCCSGLWIAGPT